MKKGGGGEKKWEEQRGSGMLPGLHVHNYAPIMDHSMRNTAQYHCSIHHPHTATKDKHMKLLLQLLDKGTHHTSS